MISTKCFKILIILSCHGCLVLGSEDNTISDTGGKAALRYPVNSSRARRQSFFSNTTPFPCQTTGPSPVKPTSVHTLRPGDLQVVAAMGDSLVAGNGALGESIFYTIFEYRGVSFCAGGDSTWREVLTVPNILKEFNPMLKGFSMGYGEYFYRDSHLNVGFPVASALDALMEAKILVKRMKRDASVDFKNDWKMVTVFFGANDICSLECFNKTSGSAPGFHHNLRQALDYLQANLPRAFVNLIPVLDVTVSVRVKRSIECRMIHRLFCMCYHMQSSDPVTYMASLAKSYQKIMDDLINSGRYDQRDDFTVVVQPFTKLFNLPKDPKKYFKEVVDVSLITYDCFHFSQKGHAFAANLLWNNLLEPVGNKSTKNLDYLLQRFQCPTENAPYLFTAKNSQNFYATGHQ